MLWRMLENAVASAMSRAMLEARLEGFFERVSRAGLLSDEEAARLRADVLARVEEVERDGRELREFVERTLSHLFENISRGGRK